MTEPTQEQLCGNCAFGAPAFNFDGTYDPNYVICQVKQSQIKRRKADSKDMTSAVFRMHKQREACIHWAPYTTNEWPIGSELEDDFDDREPPPLPPSQPDNKDYEIKLLKKQLLEKEQSLIALQNQNQYLHEQVQELQSELSEIKQEAFGLPRSLPENTGDFFSLLEVSIYSTPSEIKQAYYKKMKHYHPDKYVMLARQINLAYETLISEEKRSTYLRDYRQRFTHPPYG